MNIGIVGYGYWGKNIVRNFNALESCTVTTVCEANTERHSAFKKLYPHIDIITSYDELISDSEITGIVIATPVDAHYPLAKKALLAGKHVLVEKPMTSSAEEAQELNQIANEKGLTLMVDHTFLYTGAVQYLKKEVEKGALGDISYIDSTRINLGLFQHDVNVLWDLAPHDISICYHLINKKPISVSATGISHTPNGIENIAYLTLKFENNVIAHFNCSWVSPVKIRQMLIGGDKKMLVFNDMEPTEKIKVYDTGYEVKSDDDKKMISADYRTGDIHVPKIPTTEALYLMASDFVECIKSGNTPVSSKELGAAVVEILSAAQESISNQGKEVILGSNKVLS